jgi:hypothetical protein
MHSLANTYLTLSPPVSERFGYEKNDRASLNASLTTYIYI